MQESAGDAAAGGASARAVLWCAGGLDPMHVWSPLVSVWLGFVAGPWSWLMDTVPLLGHVPLRTDRSHVDVPSSACGSPLLCVLAGAVGHPCTVFGSLVGWELAALHSCYVLMLDLCA